MLSSKHSVARALLTALVGTVSALPALACAPQSGAVSGNTKSDELLGECASSDNVRTYSWRFGRRQFTLALNSEEIGPRYENSLGKHFFCANGSWSVQCDGDSNELDEILADIMSSTSAEPYCQPPQGNIVSIAVPVGDAAQRIVTNIEMMLSADNPEDNNRSFRCDTGSGNEIRHYSDSDFIGFYQSKRIDDDRELLRGACFGRNCVGSDQHFSEALTCLGLDEETQG